MTSLERVRRDLAEAPELYQRCESLLVRFPPAFTQRVAGGGSTGLVLDERVTSARSDILAVLASWSGLVADERGVGRPRRDTADLAAFLAVHLDWLLTHPAGPCFASELGAAAAAAREVSRSGSGPGIELGPCVEEDCDHMMVAARSGSSAGRPGPSGRPGSSGSSGSSGRPGSSGSSGSSGLEVRCAAGHAWAPRQWLRLSRQLEARS
jgi:hypothetical protein